MTSNNFDLIEMNRRGAEHIYELVKDMTEDEELAYWHVETEKLEKHIAELKVKNSSLTADKVIESLPKLDIPEKTFDCVEMKRRGAEAIHEVLQNMTFEEEVEYWRKRSVEFKQSRQDSEDRKTEKLSK